jgi:hypothetical protein
VPLFQAGPSPGRHIHGRASMNAALVPPLSGWLAIITARRFARSALDGLAGLGGTVFLPK